jgi:cytochrome c oxidase subunit 2
VRPSPGTRGLWAAAAALATAAACELPTFGAPDPKSEEGETVLSLWQGFFLAGIGVGLLVWGLLVYVLVRYRRRHGDDDSMPDQRAFHIPLEVTYTAIPIVIVAGLFGVSWVATDDINSLEPDPPITVEVIGFQWSWQFVYPDEDITVSGEPGDPPELVLPVGERARLELTSVDVAHSFWTPDFLSKRDLIPGVDNEIDVTPTETGEYIGRCAEFCGLDHWRMYYDVRVVERDEYEDWLDERRAAQQAEDGPGGQDRPLTEPSERDAEGTGSEGQGTGSEGGAL